MKKNKMKLIKQKNVCAFIGILFLITLTGCPSEYEIDTEEYCAILKTMTPPERHIEALDQSNGAVMYVDASTVFIDAEKSSEIYKSMKSQMYQYIGTLIFIKGENFESTECNRQKQALFNALEGMRTDYHYADIQKAVENICNGNRQGMIITDFEFYKYDPKQGSRTTPYNHDMDPYLSESFVKWLNRGYQIDILTEPYYEQKNLKKRFYVFFTDPNDVAPISYTMINQVEQYLVDGDPDVGHCNLVTLNNTDLQMTRVNDKNSCADDISIKTFAIEGIPSELNVVEDTWSDIKEFVMKLDSYNKLIKDEEPLPLIDGLTVNDGINYSVTKLAWHAINISKSYMVEQEKEDSLTFDTMEEWDVTDAFIVEMNDKNEVEVYLTPRIFDSKHLYRESVGFTGNLIRLDIDIDQCAVRDFDKNAFQWKSVPRGDNQGKDAVCVSLSIDNALKDLSVVPSTNERKHLYTVYIQTGSIE